MAVFSMCYPPVVQGHDFGKAHSDRLYIQGWYLGMQCGHLGILSCRVAGAWRRGHTGRCCASLFLPLRKEHLRKIGEGHEASGTTDIETLLSMVFGNDVAQRFFCFCLSHAIAPHTA